MQGVAPAIGCPAGGAGGSGGSAGIGHRLSLLGLMGSVGAVSSVGLATFEAAGALAGQPVGAVGPSDDRPGPAGGLAARLSLFSSTTTLAPKVAYSCGGPSHAARPPAAPAREGRQGRGPQTPDPGPGQPAARCAGEPWRSRAAGPLRGCGRASPARAAGRLCAAMARWCPTPPPRR
jgi:hypothetical protein